MNSTPNLVPDIPADRAEAYILSGEYDFRKIPAVGTEPPSSLRGAPILEKRELPTALRDRAKGILGEKETYGTDPARCFIPRHGFTFHDKDRKIDVLICFECFWIYFFEGENKTAIPLSEKGIEKLTEVYAAAYPEYARMTGAGLTVDIKNKKSESW